MELRHSYDLSVLLACVHLARSSFYYYAKQLCKTDKYEQVKSRIRTLYHNHKGRLGYRRITLVLRREGLLINHKTVLRLMREMNLKSVIRVKKYKSYRGEQGRIADNILARGFMVPAANQRWATDVTEFNVKGEKLYLSPIIDLYNQEIISYDISEKPTFKSIINMLDKALKKVKQTKGLLLHSDQGWQYQMKQYQHILQQKGIVQSMSRKGNCLDNAIIENFFGTLKSELYYLKKYESRAQLKNEIEEYIEYYNNERIKLNLKGMSPVQCRAHYCQN